MDNIQKYLMTAVIQGILTGVVQYIFQEIDTDLGVALMLTPLSLINISSVTTDNLPEYLMSYIYSSLYSLGVAILFFVLLTKTAFNRGVVYNLIVSTIIVTISSFVLYRKYMI